MKRVMISVCLMAVMLYGPSQAGNRSVDPPQMLDNYDISFGPELYTCMGEPDLLIPIRISVSQPAKLIKLIITYDPTLLTPKLLAPNIFVQGFNYDLSVSGQIKLKVETDLLPPPIVPPIMGDTIFAWIDCRVTTRDLFYDYVTNLDYFEDLSVPGPDNFIVLSNNNIVTPTQLGLHPATVLLIHPLYGDINLNSYIYEIGDAVLFLNYFNGIAHLNRCQLANADCNRDGVQASISDLVYMIRIITNDSMRALDRQVLPLGGSAWQPPGAAAKISGAYLSDKSYDIAVDSDQPLGGASFDFTLADSETVPEEILLDPSAAFMQMYCYLEGSHLKVTIVNWDANNTSFKGGALFSLRFARDVGIEPFHIDEADFSDNAGQRISASYHIGGETSVGETDPVQATMVLSGSPNPFRGSTSISFSLPSDGRYRLTIYDILGRKVRTLMDGYSPAGAGEVAWDGRDDAGAAIASGTYFARLQGGEKINIAKLFFLK